jgi:hypothetical protein
MNRGFDPLIAITPIQMGGLTQGMLIFNSTRAATDPPKGGAYFPD